MTGNGIYSRRRLGFGILLVILMVTLGSSAAEKRGLPQGVTNSQPAKDKPISPAEALKTITVPKGFRTTLFAGEPDVMQPIAVAWDDRGRLWVVECFSYPEWNMKLPARDRILIFFDTDGDGRFDERKVFLEGGRNLSSVALGFGGVWVTSAPDLLFIPDHDGDDRPDGKPVVHLTGWNHRKKNHNIVNGLTWGPDGWLYGQHGILHESTVGTPDTPIKERVKLNCAIWRYHPTRKVFDIVAHGTTNPWGLDFNDHGHLFFSNNVIGHLWHVVPGARYKRMYGQHYNPHLYRLMDQCADHLHFTGRWTSSRGGKGPQDARGGGHAHSGCMIYLADNFPAEYRGSVFMGNIHGNRLNRDVLQRKASGYTATHAADFLKSTDPWFRSISVTYGPDGGVIATDWNDFGECHDGDGTYRASGRIYTVTYGKPKALPAFNLANSTDAELVQLQLHSNDWYVRRARKILQERAASGKLAKETHAALLAIYDSDAKVTRKLRAMWALYTTDGLDHPWLRKQLDHSEEQIRWWAVQLLCDEGTVNVATAQRLAKAARDDPSALVRLSLASAATRLPMAQRWSISAALMSHEEDARDRNLSLMVWYGVEPLVALDRPRALGLLGKCKLPLVRQYIARRATAGGKIGKKSK
jgi:putative membrane-bound dehydrogenase-like protein